MTDGHDAGGPGEQPLLEAISATEGEPHLFPPEVLRLHREGQGLRAQRALRSHAKSERNADLARKQRERASHLHLWQEPIRTTPRMYTLNGFGTRLLGKYQETPVGAYVSVLWLTLLFVPVWPIRAYLVVPAPEGGWHFLARTPLPPVGSRVRGVTATVAALALLWVASMAIWSASHVDVYAYNGFDVPVVVRVGDMEKTVPPRMHDVFEDVPAEPMRFEAALDPASDPLESVDVDLTGRAAHFVGYNVAGRAVLELAYANYGDAAPRDGRVMDGGSVLIEESIDFPFVPSPDSLTLGVTESGALRTELWAVDEGMPPVSVVGALLEMGRPEQALDVARAELTVHPEDAELAFYAAWALIDDLDARFDLLRWCMNRAPESVDLHRSYQNLWPDERSDDLRGEYAALLAEHPESPMYHYLAGRVEGMGSAAALVHFREALGRDPEYLPALRAMGYQAMDAEEWAEAAAYFDRVASAGSMEALEIIEERTRAHRRAGGDLAGVDAILAATAATNPEALLLQLRRAHIRVTIDPSALDAAVTEMVENAVGVFGSGGEESITRNVRADLKITLGDLVGAGADLDAIGDPMSMDPSVALRLALSDGARDADRERLLDLQGWPDLVGLGGVIAGMHLLPLKDRVAMTTGEQDDLAEIASVLSGPDVASPGRLQEICEKLRPDQRMWVYFTAARRLAETGANEVARRAYLVEMRGLSLPGDLPHLRR